ncbi:hypothetical protein IQ241_02570 [Romeria aff. gracilis LEGE 07310]|uniref:Uncharacterized protein n=1 Tax=Vasconcelosia minhoensis LEGE 07310 TaxID=915328 RepID=A0A8J7ATG3_9CYAN|nr:hypothetical protein [Romeria gracilis]MBE9076188.1 hypothetical protein [Romeria aff. gracilis LEGE 07310]
MSETRLRPAQIWDLAGVESLQALQQLLGPTVAQLSPFQSLETSLDGQCSVLRLCDRNFRLAYNGDLSQHIDLPNSRTWLKQLNWMGAIAIPDDDFPLLLALASVRPPHRLQGLPLHRAVPAQVGAISVLIWRHPLAGQPAIEIHTATADLAKLKAKISARVT